MTFEKKQTRSGKYQHVIMETPVSDDFLCSFSNNKSIGAHLNPFQYDERLLELRDQLYKRTLEILHEYGTERQQQLFTLYYIEGKTQEEIAKLLDCNQSSVTKGLHGNTDYKYGKAIYGGLEKKLKRLTQKDPTCQAILKQMDEIRENIL